jgi:hypothetical protein
MSDEEGTLRMQPSGRWAVCRPGCDPIQIRSGDVFRVEVPGEDGLRRTRMEHKLGEGYYRVNGYNLRDGLRAAIGDTDSLLSGLPRGSCKPAGRVLGLALLVDRYRS